MSIVRYGDKDTPGSVLLELEFERVRESTESSANTRIDVEDFVLVQLTLEEGRGVGTLVCYVAQVLSMKEGGRLNLSFLRMKSAVTRDTFTFPNVQDEAEVDPGQCLGVLKVAKGITKRQADLVKVFPPLLPFNMYI
ncbi:hypothetical protein Pmani_019134 [Petrolisthes manimaculis]|uniref:Uncharacterized protein n=1 Tax=Petrolisthes manimaculis TaxID=1843537 RepID=A0AAE1PIW2_9EUCA|nr:hypothetical protein Pmani_019134 [Petrolisthes manimaculis]